MAREITRERLLNLDSYSLISESLSMSIIDQCGSWGLPLLVPERRQDVY